MCVCDSRMTSILLLMLIASITDLSILVHVLSVFSSSKEILVTKDQFILQYIPAYSSISPSLCGSVVRYWTCHL